MKKTSIYPTSGIFFLLIALFYACSSDDGSYNGIKGFSSGGSMARFSINGDYLYTVDNQKLRLFDIKTPAKPDYLSSKDQTVGFNIETLFIKDTLLFIGSEEGMYIYNIKRPEFPQQLSFTSHITSCDPVVARGSHAYVTLNSSGTWCFRGINALQVYDISNPKKPVQIGNNYPMESPKGLGIDNTKLFICDKGVKVYDITDPANPEWTDDLTHIPEANNIEAYDVIPAGGLLIVTGTNGLYQFDYTGTRLKFVSKIEIKSDRI